MTINEALIDPELQRVLWACLTYWNTEPNPLDGRAVCYSWVARCYKDRFGGTCENRRYYRISDPAQLAEFLKDCNPELVPPRNTNSPMAVSTPRSR